MSKQVAAALVALLVATGVNAVTCPNGQEAVLIPANDREVHFPNDVPAGQCAYAGGNTWDSFPSFPGSSTYLDALTLLGSTPVYWYQGSFDGPMGPEEDSETYYECSGSHGWPGVPYPCLPYHTTAGINPENSSGSIEVVNAYVRDFGDGFSPDLALPYGTTVRIRKSLLEFLHDDALEDDHCRLSYVLDDSFVDRAFMLFANRASSSVGSCTDAAGGRKLTIHNSWLRVWRFTHAYNEKAGHGGWWKRDDGRNPDKYITNNRFLFGPVAGDQSFYPPVSEVKACLGNVVLWDGTTAAYNTMLTRKNNGTNLAAIQGGSSPPFPGCFTVVIREQRCPSCTVDLGGTSWAFMNLALPELGGKSWNQNRIEWLKANGFAGSASCGIGPELALALPLLAGLRRRARGRSA